MGLGLQGVGVAQVLDARGHHQPGREAGGGAAGTDPEAGLEDRGAGVGDCLPTQDGVLGRGEEGHRGHDVGTGRADNQEQGGDPGQAGGDGDREPVAATAHHPRLPGVATKTATLNMARSVLAAEDGVAHGDPARPVCRMIAVF